MTTRRTICQEGHELLLAMEESYGDLVNHWRRIADAVSRRTGTTVTAETALWVLVEMHLERLRRSTVDPGHLRGAVTHLAILAQVHAAELAAVDHILRRSAGQGRTP